MRDERVAAEPRAARARRCARSAATREACVDEVRDALYAAKICAYAQGMGLLRAGARARSGASTSPRSRASGRGGCIIRARFLGDDPRRIRRDPTLPEPAARRDFARALAATPGAPGAGSSRPRPAPASRCPRFAASLAYFDSYRTARLPQNLIQAQRDFFGAHTYERVDHPERGFVHSEWLR